MGKIPPDLIKFTSRELVLWNLFLHAALELCSHHYPSLLYSSFLYSIGSVSSMLIQTCLSSSHNKNYPQSEKYNKSPLDHKWPLYSAPILYRSLQQNFLSELHLITISNSSPSLLASVSKFTFIPCHFTSLAFACSSSSTRTLKAGGLWAWF